MASHQEKIEDTDLHRVDDRIDMIVKSDVYLDLIKRKKRFLVRVIIFFMCFYFALPLGIILFPKVMAFQVFHHFTIAWVYAFLQFVMIWALGGLYFFKAKQFDRLAEKAAPWRQEP